MESEGGKVQSANRRVPVKDFLMVIVAKNVKKRLECVPDDYLTLSRAKSSQGPPGERCGRAPQSVSGEKKRDSESVCQSKKSASGR
jgi:hypothetical protein